MKITDRELATILDALRLWQQRRMEVPGFVAFADYFNVHRPLHVNAAADDDDEVDVLCEKLNARQSARNALASIRELLVDETGEWRDSLSCADVVESISGIIAAAGLGGK